MPSAVLNKPGRLDADEFEIIKGHSMKGYEIFAPVEFELPVASMVRQHHEKLDGSGYPDGLEGDDITLEAQIICVADIAHALMLDRPYRKGLGVEVTLEELNRHAGVKYNQQAVDMCTYIFEQEPDRVSHAYWTGETTIEGNTSL